MRSPKLAAWIAAALLAPAAGSALPLNATVGIEARGLADTDGRLLPNPPLSSLLEAEVTPPFARSVVAVADGQAGLYSYAASADLGTLALRASGSLTNATGATLFGQGVPLLQAVAEARDVITLSSASSAPYDVTLQLLVSGVVSTSANSLIGANSLISLRSAGVLKQTDASSYSASGIVSDVLTVTITVAGPLVEIELESLLSVTVVAVAAGETVSADLSNTALLNLVLPAGVTIAGSSSGTFGVPIPEPALPALLEALFGALFRRGRVSSRINHPRPDKKHDERDKDCRLFEEFFLQQVKRGAHQQANACWARQKRNACQRAAGHGISPGGTQLSGLHAALDQHDYAKLHQHKHAFRHHGRSRQKNQRRVNRRCQRQRIRNPSRQFAVAAKI